MNIIQLPLQERIATGCSHCAVIDFNDLDGEGDTAITLTLYSGVARDIIDKVFVDLITPYDGTSTTALALDVGYNLSSGTDDTDAFIDAAELHNDATDIVADHGTVAAVATDTVNETFGTEESTVIASLRDTVNFLRARRPWVATAAYTLEATFTSTTANLTDLTSGKNRIYFNVIPVSKLRGINNT